MLHLEYLNTLEHYKKSLDFSFIINIIYQVISSILSFIVTSLVSLVDTVISFANRTLGFVTCVDLPFSGYPKHAVEALDTKIRLARGPL